MISQLQELGLEFDKEVLKHQFYKPQGDEIPPLSWGNGAIHNEFHGFNLLADSMTRTPSEYVRYDHHTGLPRVPEEKLVKTNEKVHSSVRIRWGHGGKDHEKKDYASPALKGWKVEGTQKSGVNGTVMDAQGVRNGQKNIVWRKEQKSMQEEVVSDLEWELILGFKPDIGKDFLSIAPKV